MAKGNPQHDILFALLKQYSDRYYTETEMVYSRFGRSWNPYPCRFEIDVFFLFHTSSYKHGASYRQNTREKVCMDFEDRLLQFYSTRLATEGDLQDILRNRIERYFERIKWALRDDEPRDFEYLQDLDESLAGFARMRKASEKFVPLELLEILLRNIDSAIAEEQVALEPVLVIVGYFERAEFESNMLPIQLCVIPEFLYCLQQIFRSTSDIYSLTIEEVDSLIDRGKEEAKQKLPSVEDLSQIAYLHSATYRIRKLLKDGLFSVDQLLEFTDSEIVRRIIMRQKDLF